MLVIDGTTLMQKLNLKPGPQIGNMLHILLAEVLEDPSRNNEDTLLVRAKELLQLPEKDLADLGEKGKVRRFEEEEGQIAKIRKKYHVE